MSFFVRAQGIKTAHAEREGVRKWKNSVHVVVECPLMLLRHSNELFFNDIFADRKIENTRNVITRNQMIDSRPVSYRD